VKYSALSIKQPWATLLAHGLKTIEVRRWRTHYRGLLLLHAANIPDDRPEAWEHVPAELREEAQRGGGIIGCGRLTACKPYRTLANFRNDQASHLNDPSWFDPAGLFGLCFADLQVRPFREYKGYVRIFEVELEDLGIELHSAAVAALPSPAPAPGHGLLVSVRNPTEAEAALAGGAAIIDVKEPANGALGRADPDVLTGVLAAVAGRRPVSAALGELPDGLLSLPADLARLAYVKCGLAGWRERGSAWQERLLQLREQVETRSPCRLVAVAYADWKVAGAPSVLEVARFAVSKRWSVLLIDTWGKSGSDLLGWMSLTELEHLRQLTRSLGVQLALAGSLNEAKMQTLGGVVPDWFAVRGAACTKEDRGGIVEADRVRRLVEVVQAITASAQREG
jgi:uncharacterized protein (UPF0264 family)